MQGLVQAQVQAQGDLSNPELSKTDALGREQDASPSLRVRWVRSASLPMGTSRTALPPRARDL
jgi:hypothetical protein